MQPVVEIINTSRTIEQCKTETITKCIESVIGFLKTIFSDSSNSDQKLDNLRTRITSPILSNVDMIRPIFQTLFKCYSLDSFSDLSPEAVCTQHLHGQQRSKDRWHRYRRLQQARTGSAFKQTIF